jgi:hypothetical protein
MATILEKTQVAGIRQVGARVEMIEVDEPRRCGRGASQNKRRFIWCPWPAEGRILLATAALCITENLIVDVSSGSWPCKNGLNGCRFRKQEAHGLRPRSQRSAA